MRRSYITPEFINNKVNGSFNTKTTSNFFGSGILNIEEKLNIGNENIVWYQNSNNEQINISIESISDPNFYSSTEDKFNNHKIEIDKSQSSSNKNTNTRWVMKININKILINFLFSNIKKFRTFESVKNEENIYKNVDLAILDYIEENIVNSYKFKKIDFYLKNIRIDNNEKTRFTNTWNEGLTKEYIINKYESRLNEIDNILKINFEQDDSSKYVYEYYYDLTFEKI